MRKSTLLLASGLALVFAVIATFLILSYMKQHIAKTNAEMVPVVVAVQDLTFGNTLKAEQMKVVEYPKTSLPKGYYSTPDSLVGEVTKVFLMENEPIIANKLSSTGGGLSLKIPDSLRAVSLSVDKVSGVSGFALPGDRVDVIASIDRYGAKNEAIATIVLQNIEVLASGLKTEQQGDDKNIQGQSVTLLVNSIGAQTLALASRQAKMSLALRNPNDTDTLTIAGITQQELFEGKKKKEAPKVVYVQKPEPKPVVKEEPKPVDNTVKIYRGSTEKVTTPPLAPGQAEPTKTTPN